MCSFLNKNVSHPAPGSVSRGSVRGAPRFRRTSLRDPSPGRVVRGHCRPLLRLPVGCSAAWVMPMGNFPAQQPFLPSASASRALVVSSVSRPGAGRAAPCTELAVTLCLHVPLCGTAPTPHTPRLRQRRVPVCEAWGPALPPPPPPALCAPLKVTEPRMAQLSEVVWSSPWGLLAAATAPLCPQVCQLRCSLWSRFGKPGCLPSAAYPTPSSAQWEVKGGQLRPNAGFSTAWCEHAGTAQTCRSVGTGSRVCVWQPWPL